MENQIATVDQEMAVYSPDQMLSQVKHIQAVMAKAMKKDEHYGVIPGCGPKPALLKPGAEKLLLTFRLAPSFQIERIDMPRENREYSIVCTIKSIQNGVELGQGVGSCSTMENKFRYRGTEKEFTDQPIPAKYWDLKKTDFVKAQELIGGKGFSAGKNDAGQYVICIQGEKKENDNPADLYNTILKMAKKRALVDAVLTVTAASDIFVQDVEENPDLYAKNGQQKSAETTKQNKPAKNSKKKPPTGLTPKREKVDKALGACENHSQYTEVFDGFHNKYGDIWNQLTGNDEETWRDLFDFHADRIIKGTAEGAQ